MVPGKEGQAENSVTGIGGAPPTNGRNGWTGTMSALDDGAAFMRFMGGFAQDGSPAERGLAGGQRRPEEARGLDRRSSGGGGRRRRWRGHDVDQPSDDIRCRAWRKMDAYNTCHLLKPASLDSHVRVLPTPPTPCTCTFFTSHQNSQRPNGHESRLHSWCQEISWLVRPT